MVKRNGKKFSGVKGNSVYMMAILLAIGFTLSGCGLLGDQPVAPAPAVPLPTAADVAQVPPTPTPAPTIAPPTPTLPAPRVTGSTVTPLSVPSVTPLAIPTLTPQPVPTALPTVPANGGRAVIGEDGRIYLGDQLLLDPAADVGGCFDPGEISYAPTEEYFVVVLSCFEGDNHAFIFKEDGGQKRQITGLWDFVNYDNFEWSDDGQEFIYQRINSCCAEPPPDAPPPGRVSFNVETGQKILLEAAQLPPTAVPPTQVAATQVPPTQAAAKVYRVINVASDDVLNIRSGPGVSNGIIGTIPYNGTGVVIIGGGTNVMGSLWVPIQYGGVTGWVNSHFLAEG